MTHDEEIIKEATEAVEKNLSAGCYVGDLLRIIKSQKAEIERLKEALKDLKREMSYMSSPNTIGDRHEMGCW